MTDAALALARRLELEVWGAGDLDVLGEIAHESYTVHDVGLARTIRGRDAVRADMAWFRETYAIQEVVIEDAIPSGDRVAVRWTLRATHAGRPVEARGVDLLRVEDGRLAEAWVISNDAELEQQVDAPAIADADVARWIDDYARAWRERDADGAAALFAEDGVYRSAPFRPPHVGRDEIRRYWREEPMLHEDVDLRFGDPVVRGRRAAVEWWVTVFQDGETITGPGCLVLRFDAGGLCEELREYWQEETGRVEPPPGWGR